jgi:hypothetical protein
MEKSIGHIGFFMSTSGEMHEMYTDAEDQVRNAPVGNVFENGRRIGRWECSKHHWDVYKIGLMYEWIDG